MCFSPRIISPFTYLFILWLNVKPTYRTIYYPSIYTSIALLQLLIHNFFSGCLPISQLRRSYSREQPWQYYLNNWSLFGRIARRGQRHYRFNLIRIKHIGLHHQVTLNQRFSIETRAVRQCYNLGQKYLILCRKMCRFRALIKMAL